MDQPAVPGVSRRTIALAVIAGTCYLTAVVLVAAADRFAGTVLLVSHTFAALVIGWARLQRHALARAENGQQPDNSGPPPSQGHPRLGSVTATGATGRPVDGLNAASTRRS